MSAIGSFISTEVSPEISTKRKQTPTKSKTKEIINQIFDDCRAVVEDEFWKDLLEDMSYGKMPRGFSFSDGVLKYVKGTKKQSIPLSKNPLMCVEEIKNFMRNGNIISENDLTENKESSNVIIKWKTLSKKAKEYLIIEYVYRTASQLGMTKEDRAYLLELVNDILFNYVDSSKVQLKLRQLDTIPGLLWKGNTPYRDPSLKIRQKSSKSSSKKDVEVSYYFSNSWKSIVNRIKKRNGIIEEASQKTSTTTDINETDT